MVCLELTCWVTAQMPDYCAAITTSADGRGDWSLTEDKAKALASDDKGQAIFVSNLMDLRYELEQRFPAPEHCAVVFPQVTDEFGEDYVRYHGSGEGMRVLSIPHASRKLQLAPALQLVKDNPEGLILHSETLGYDLTRTIHRSDNIVIGDANEYIVEYYDSHWFKVIYNPKRAKRILGADGAAIRRRLSQGIWPFDTELALFRDWRDWLLKTMPAIDTVFQTQYYYQAPRTREKAHDAFVCLKTLTMQLRLMSKIRKQPFFKYGLRRAAQYLPGMMRKKDYHTGIIKFIQEELKAAGLKGPADIPKVEI